MKRVVKVVLDDLTIDLDLAGINIEVEFDRDSLANIAVAEVYNTSKYSEEFKETGREIVISAGNGDTENVIFKGIYNEFDYFEDTRDIRTVLHCSDDHTALFNTLINKKYLNTTYTAMLKLIASEMGLDIGEISIEKDIQFESYTIYKNLQGFLEEVKKNTGVMTYIKEGALYATSPEGEEGSIEISSEMVLQRSYIGNDRYKLIFNELVGEIEANVVLDIAGEKLVVDKGSHFSSSKTGEHFTEVEVISYG